MVASGKTQSAMEPGMERAREGATARSKGANADEKANSERTQRI